MGKALCRKKDEPWAECLRDWGGCASVFIFSCKVLEMGFIRASLEDPRCWKDKESGGHCEELLGSFFPLDGGEGIVMIWF